MMKTIVNFIKWIGTTVEDKRGRVSSRRIALFWCLLMLQQTISEPSVSPHVIYGIVGLSFGLAGLTMPEWINKGTKADNDDKQG